MALASGTRLGPYEIISPLGVGGMGEVYRGRDTRLDRTIAIKVLLAHLADDSDRRQRFEREARAVSSLTHPHICALYDIGHQDGIDFLVMEYLEGETLDQRLVRGPLPLDQAISYGIEIADALAQAHRQGLVHRDLKPANIMLTRTGAKLLDFGLAKSLDCEASVVTSEGVARAGETKSLTAEGAILGTLQYMAPEQVEGSDADARTDLFALGTVLYEMATGRKAFEGKSQASLLAAILEREPAPMAAFQPITPPALDHVVRRCLAKDPDERWQAASDVRRELQWIGATAGQSSVTAARGLRQRSRARLAWTVAGVLATAGALGFIAFVFLRAPIAIRPITFTVSPPDGTTLTPGPIAVSPDGHQLAFAASSAGVNHLWVRSLDSLAAHELPDTDGARGSFWSPDSRSLAFFSGGKLKKVDISGGRPQVLCSADGGTSGSWSDAGVILFPTKDGLSRVSDAGGSATLLTRLDSSTGETTHDFPQFLPDRRHFIYAIVSTRPEHTGVFIGSLDSAVSHRRLLGTASALYVPPGYLLFWRNGELLAQPFNAATLEMGGVATPVADVLAYGVMRGIGMFAASATGVLAYVSPAQRQLGWVDRVGRPLGSIGTPGRDVDPALSPDDARVAVSRVDPSTNIADIWVIDSAGTTAFRLTSHGGNLPVWSPDGSHIAFSAFQEGRYHLRQKLSSGDGNEGTFVTSSTDEWPADWSRDGRFLLFFHPTASKTFELWALPLTPDRKPIWLMNTGWYGGRAQLSPNGRWFAYTSNESGADEVYLRPFPAGDSKRQISLGGGIEPRWRRDGRELFFVAPDQQMMAVPVDPDIPLPVGLPKALFQTRILISTHAVARRQYVVTADGQRFLINQPAAGPTSSPITVVINWQAALAAREK
jgi:Tol biopolymer transport system component